MLAPACQGQTEPALSSGKCSRGWEQNLLKINLHFLGVNHNVPNFCGSAILSEEELGSEWLPGIFRVVLSDREKCLLSPAWIPCNACVFQWFIQQLQGGHWVMFPSSCFLPGGFWCQWSPQRELAMGYNFSWGFYQSGSAWTRGKEAAVISALSVKLKNIPVFFSVTEKEKGKEMAKLHNDFSTSDRHEVLLWSDCDLGGGIHMERTEFITSWRGNVSTWNVSAGLGCSWNAPSRIFCVA